MVHFYIGADRCGAGEMSAMKTIAKELRKCGHKVDIGTVTPEQESASYRVSKKKVFLFLVCGVAPATMWSFKVSIAKGGSPPTIFLHGSWANSNPSSPMRSEKKMLNCAFKPEWDSGGFANSSAMSRDAGSAKTVGEYVKKYSKYIGVAWASTPKEMGEKLCNGDVTGYGSQLGSSSQSGSSGNSKSKNNNSSSNYSGSSNGQDSTGSSGSSPLLNGEQTFEDLIGDICKSIDLIFAVKRSTVVVTDYESIYAQAKYLRDNAKSVVESEDVKLWQIEDGSFELDVNQYGYYNTVRVHYKNGVVVEDYEDLVSVFGTVAIDYYEPKIDKATAQMKAKSYLAAHVRDFDMAIRATILHDGDIEIGDIVTIDNPMTVRDDIRKSEGRDPEYYFVKGTSVSWEGNSYITCDLDLRYGAESPEGKEIPEAGTSYSNDKKGTGSGIGAKDLQSALDEVGQKYHKFGYCGDCQSASCTKKAKCGDCYGMSDLLACELQALGVETKIVQYPSPYSGSGTHRSVLYKDNNGKWKDFPYRTYGFHENFNDLKASKTSTNIIRKTCGG